jgi:hypothetical protein
MILHLPSCRDIVLELESQSRFLVKLGQQFLELWGDLSKAGCQI